MSRFDTPIKRKSRERELEFDQKTLPKLDKPPSKIKVFCLPYTSPTQALEVTSVFDKINVPRINITGAERVKERSDDLESQELQINLFSGEARDFFATTKDRFDVISLDFEGQLSDDVLTILRYISSRQVLSPKGILSVNLYGKREKLKVKTHYDLAGTTLQDQFRIWLEQTDPTKLKNFSWLDIVRDPELLKLYKEFRRDIGISRRVLSIMYNGRHNLYLPDIFQINPRFGNINESYRRKTGKLFQDQLKQGNKNYLNGVCKRALEDQLFLLDADNTKHYFSLDEGILLSGEYDEDLVKRLDALLRDGAFIIFDESQFTQLHSDDILAQLKTQDLGEQHMKSLLLRSAGHYFLSDLERYKYTTPTTGKMFMDLFYFDRSRDVLGCYDDVTAKPSKKGLIFRVAPYLARDSQELKETLEYFGYLERNTLSVSHRPRVVIK
ncbi:MAG: hypothetical protein HYW23_00375 [Candidatus Aenigmarchaeota archaeon]|nr:hypothetical protein [Candidatus Aenigmarchaeota archaeon]